jgi:hypothetical protein
MNETPPAPLRLNAYALHFSAPQFTAFRHKLPNPQDLRELRDRVKADWFVYWREGIAWGRCGNIVIVGKNARSAPLPIVIFPFNS